jgi:nucleolin
MTIYVRNLSPKISRWELIECFEKHGEVTDVTISTYKIQGQFKALGFVEMPSKDQALAAIAALQGQDLGGNLLEIQGP